jgi:integrase
VSDNIYKRCKCKGPDGKELGTGCLDLRRKDGSWNSHHGTWYFSLELPKGAGGKRKPRMRRGGFARREDAEEAREKAKAILREGVDPSSRVTVGTYLAEWLGGRKSLKPSTMHNYTVSVNTYLIPLLGHIELQRLTPLHISRAFATIREWNDELAEGRPVRAFQRHVGPAAMQRIRNVLRSALRDAKKARLVTYNAAEDVDMEPEGQRKPAIWTAERVRKFWRDYEVALEQSPLTRGDRAWRVWRSAKLRPSLVMMWTTDDLGAFLERAAGGTDFEARTMAALFELAVATGMRRGELCALPWHNVDLDKGVLYVTTAAVQAGWNVVQGGPKTEKGHRRVALAAADVARLKAHRAAAARQRLEYGPDWTETDLVFTQSNGKPWHPNAITATFERTAFAAHLPPVGFHSLRHAHITYLYTAKVAEHVISDRVGHSGKKMTQAYAAVAEEISHEAAEAVAAMIPRRSAR